MATGLTEQRAPMVLQARTGTMEAAQQVAPAAALGLGMEATGADRMLVTAGGLARAMEPGAVAVAAQGVARVASAAMTAIRAPAAMAPLGAEGPRDCMGTRGVTWASSMGRIGRHRLVNLA